MNSVCGHFKNLSSYYKYGYILLRLKKKKNAYKKKMLKL